MNAKYWSTLQVAGYLRLSPSWVRKKIREGTIEAIKAGPFAWPKRECYCITREEVMRVLREVPLPRTGETRADRLERGRDRLYRGTGMDARREVNRVLSLDFRSDDRFLISCVLALTSHPPRKRKKRAA